MTNEEGVIKALEEFHHRILKTNLSYHIRESEMMAIVDVIGLINRLNTDYEQLKNKHRETLTKQIELCDIIEKQKVTIDKCMNVILKKEDTEQSISRERQQYYDELQAARAEIEKLNIKLSRAYEYIGILRDG